MTDPVDAIAPVQSVTPSAPVAPRAELRAEAPAPPALARPEPIALDVQRGEDGVFVYTLTDPSTGRLVAVIPGEAKARTTGTYASGGWISLTA